MSLTIITKTSAPKQLNSQCDGLSITLDVPKKYRAPLKENISDLTSPAPLNNYNVSKRIALNKEYLPAGADKTGKSNVLLQCDPKGVFPDMRFLRLEFNPMKIYMDEFRSVMSDILPFNYEFLMSNGIVTKFDLAIDIVNLDINQMTFRYPGTRVTRIETYSGRTEYLGSRSSSKLFRIYDKRVQIKELNKKKSLVLKEKVPNYPLTRIELSIKPGKPLLDIPKDKNPLKALQVVSYDSLNFASDNEKLFLKVMRLEGTQSALLTISDKNIRKIYADKLKNVQALWWNADKAWNEMHDIVSGIINPLSTSKN